MISLFPLRLGHGRIIIVWGCCRDEQMYTLQYSCKFYCTDLKIYYTVVHYTIQMYTIPYRCVVYTFMYSISAPPSASLSRMPVSRGREMYEDLKWRFT